MTIYSNKFRIIFDSVKVFFEGAPGCHDWGHTLRVLHNARTIASKEKKADLQIVELGALLHDVGRPAEFNSKGKLCHAMHGGAKAAEFLANAGFDEGKLVRKVTECVRRHRFRVRGPLKPETIEEKIVYDADKLDSIGAIGIGRAFHFAGRIGAKLHNTQKEALGSESYGREDTAYREYLVKLRRIRNRMLTPAGRKLAEKRHAFMRGYFEELNREVYKSR
jgi:uncharacterized protein